MHILSIEILTNDLVLTEKFYHKVLGFKIIHQDTASICFQVGTSELIFKQSTVIQKPVYHIAFEIPCNQIVQASEWLSARVDVIGHQENDGIVDFANWQAKSVYFFDNGGNVIELIARFDLQNYSKSSFCANSLLSVSEAGIATDDVNVLADQLIADINLPVFAKQNRGERFAVLGDENGLLILSDISRHWFPTMQWVEKFPILLKIKIGDKIIELIFND